MKMLRYVYVAASLPALARSFAGPTTVRTLAKASSPLLASSAASNHNEEEKKLETAMFKSWTDLQKKGKQLEYNPAADDALQLAEEVLEMALAYTHTKELIEESHVHSAHEALEKAIDTERTLERAEKEALRDIAEAELYLQDHPSSSAQQQAKSSGDSERHRQMVIADISHRVENYVESRLFQAQQAEQQARVAELEAQEHLQELQKREEDLKTTLDELKLYKLREETQL